MYEDGFPFKPGARVNGYVRDSGGDTQDLSVKQQVQELKRFCAQKNLRLHKIYIDEAKSGTSTIRRTAFSQMIARFRSKECREEGLILWNYSRFARNLADFQFFIYDLQRRGFRIHAIKDKVPDGLEGQLIRFVMAWSAQQYSEKLSEDAKRGLEHLVTEYGGIPGTPPPGFKRVPVEIGTRRNGKPRIVHRWEIDDSSTGPVLEAWRLRAAGASYSEIIERTKIYRSTSSLSAFFRNRLYIGILGFGELTIEGYCEPLVDDATWEAVQRRNRRNAKAFDPRHPNHPNRLRGSYLLTGLVYCGHCGSAVNGAVVSSGGKVRYSYYWCNLAKRRGGCEAARVPKDLLEVEVVRHLKEQILTPAALTEFYETDVQMRAELAASGDKERRRLRQDAGEIKQKLTRIADAIEEAGTSQVLLERLARLEGELASVETELEVLEEELKHLDLVLTPEDLVQLADHLQREFDGDLDAQRAVLRGFVRRIEVSRSGNDIAVVLHFKPPLKKDLGQGDKIMPRVQLPYGASPGHKNYVLEFSFKVRPRGRPPK